MSRHEKEIALGVLQALNAARLIPGDAELAKASAMALPERGISGDLFRENTFVAIRNLRISIDEGENEERLNALYSAAVDAAYVWVEARSDSQNET
ncbi:hypothetical protein [Afipia felis]|uniref:Uncharacterized protein n=2 Tax=Afipia felis TaxID=1035 RepID=A0A380W2B2_AFIFE|nr:hypothetical protein [Afipia felis]EKS30263.1 hypothetical protein HMPREF9697_02791 [Afipia felis ATCC 53690]SUU75008.1 Uncharacterised protein [Afipia felis]SUU83074.1 Uncharacterised protein [Afipia felis]